MNDLAQRERDAYDEKYSYGPYDDDAEEEYTQYALNLGAESECNSICPTPPVLRRLPSLQLDSATTLRQLDPAPVPTLRHVDSMAALRRRGGEKKGCGVCGESPVRPTHTLCCSQVFCAAHIAGLSQCPACDTSFAPAPAPAPSPLSYPPSPPPMSPTSPTASTSSTAFSHESHTSHSDPSEEEEDTTDYSFPALSRARLLQSRRHAPHPFNSVLGVRGGVFSLLRVLGCVLIVGVLAASGRWGGREGVVVP